jgi:hypothetical protein
LIASQRASLRAINKLPADTDVDRTLEGIPLAMARLHRQPVAREHAIRVGAERPRKVAFHGRDRHLLAARREVETRVYWRAIELYAEDIERSWP